MRIVYYTSSTTGIGRLVTGMAIGNALSRRGVSCKYTILHSSPFGHLAEHFDARWVPVETEDDLAPARWNKSILYKTFRKLKPDVLLVHHQWFMVHHFIKELPCKKIYLSDQAFDSHFKVPLPSGTLEFSPGSYDRVFAIEPFQSAVPMETVNPVILKNRDEIMPRKTALERLHLDGAKPVALYALSGKPEYFDLFKSKYAHLKEEGYEVIHSSTYHNGIFPAVDYFNAFDLIVCGAGYNQVWEAIYFGKKAIFEMLDVNFSDQASRIKAGQTFSFDVNGADQLADIILGL
ncbi:MAG TPA: hypothetical protein PLC28_19230 [Spirochaetota bacterium]|nr:hypothetical protein [Spirochaetota bacterium]HPL18182.1 hypothetical protein [Spirochaetota bacterium]HQJ72848.1 hypothetical protein [Spirochaetota bacterium]HRS79586.1 hypothetical protein [Spirochaetota bacterium]HRT77303.1 hypothetical protein [Spirochaetota bacterium]